MYISGQTSSEPQLDKDPIILEIDEETLLECDTEDDCPASVPKCNLMMNDTPSGKKGYCVPDKCIGKKKLHRLLHLYDTECTVCFGPLF